MIGLGVVLVAGCFASLIWRLDLSADGGEPSIRAWLKHESMGYFPGKMQPEQPGVNGIRYAAKTQYLYYISTAKKLFMRIKVDPQTLDPTGEPELVVAGRMADDFCIDEDAEVIYLTTHRQNTIDVVSMDLGMNSGFTQSIAGHPFTKSWSDRRAEHGEELREITDASRISSWTVAQRHPRRTGPKTRN